MTVHTISNGTVVTSVEAADLSMLTSAKARSRVRLADGRTATLVYWPIPVGVRRASPGRSRGARPRVQLDSGVILGVNIDDITAVIA